MRIVGHNRNHHVIRLFGGNALQLQLADDQAPDARRPVGGPLTLAVAGGGWFGGQHDGQLEGIALPGKIGCAG